jgi:hypothetical protein
MLSSFALAFLRIIIVGKIKLFCMTNVGVTKHGSGLVLASHDPAYRPIPCSRIGPILGRDSVNYAPFTLVWLRKHDPTWYDFSARTLCYFFDTNNAACMRIWYDAGNPH